MSPAPVTIHAPAKINLALRVHRRREDGFHELTTLMVGVSLYDTLHISAGSSTQDERVTLSVRDARPRTISRSAAQHIPTDASNLVVRAATRLLHQVGGTTPIHIRLVKRIPAAAGLGGGSSDAASTLLGVARLIGLPLDAPLLDVIAAELGSDINFFLPNASAAICTGRGEEVRRLARSTPVPLVLVAPDAPLSTGSVFGGLRPDDFDPASVSDLADVWCSGRRDRLPELAGNGLQSAAVRLSPTLHDVQSAMSCLPFGLVQMSGSGSAWFGLCRTTRQAEHLAGQLRSTLGHPAYALHTL